MQATSLVLRIYGSKQAYDTFEHACRAELFGAYADMEEAVCEIHNSQLSYW